MQSVAVLVFFVLRTSVRPVSAQFPRVCAANATLSGASCCPNDCGGPARGACVPLSPISPQTDLAPPQLIQDDRLDWPVRFFEFGCSCRGNFWGFACHLCRPGWTGADCSEKAPLRIRRNALRLTTAQRRVLRDVLQLAKELPSDWVVLNCSSSDNADPVPLRPAFYNVTVYDFFVFMHVYAARSTMVDRTMEKCSPEDHVLDFAHNGPAFLPWHRYYLMWFEMELDAIAKKYLGATEPFALPYWDWLDRGQCDVCTNDLIGAINSSDPRGGLDRNSPFSKWRGFCPQRSEPDDCHVCDPTQEQPELWRTYNEREVFKRLPSQGQLDYLMTLQDFDTPPFDREANASSFRNVLEGFIDANNNFNDSREGRLHLHNLVHSYMNGTWFDVATSPNDPLFWFHHCFVDKIFELWLRKQGPNASVLPEDVRPGHRPEDPIVPFFPPVPVSDFFVDSKTLGIDFDDQTAGTFKLQTSGLAAIELNKEFFRTVAIVEGTVLAVVLISLFVCLLVHYRRRKAQRMYDYVESVSTNERTPLLDERKARPLHDSLSSDSNPVA